MLGRPDFNDKDKRNKRRVQFAREQFGAFGTWSLLPIAPWRRLSKLFQFGFVKASRFAEASPFMEISSDPFSTRFRGPVASR